MTMKQADALLAALNEIVSRLCGLEDALCNIDDSGRGSESGGGGEPGLTDKRRPPQLEAVSPA